MQVRITELESLAAQHVLGGTEFDLMCQLLAMFQDSICEMTPEQQRTAIRAVVRKVVWDGQNAHVVLFGADEKSDWQDISQVLSLPESKIAEAGE